MVLVVLIVIVLLVVLIVLVVLAVLGVLIVLVVLMVLVVQEVLEVLMVLVVLPVQACDHVPHGVDQALVLLRAADDDAVQLLHVGVDGVQGGRLSTGCRGRQDKTGSSKPSATSQ